MKNKKIISVIAVCSLFLCMFFNLPISLIIYGEYCPAIEEFTADCVKVETGNMFDSAVATAGYKDYEYNIYANIGYYDDGSIYVKQHYAIIPLYDCVKITIPETADAEKAWEAVYPVVQKYSYKYVTPLDLLKMYGELTLYKNNSQSINEFINQSNSFMVDLKNTGYVSEYYPPGNVFAVETMSGEFEGYPIKHKEIIEKYVTENLPDYDLMYSDDYLFLKPNNSVSLQRRYDVVMDIWKNTGIGKAFGVFQGQWVDKVLGNSIKLLKDTQQTITTTVTTPSKTTGTTVSTTVTTTSTTQQTELLKPVGDADGDNEITVRDCSFIAVMIAEGKSEVLSEKADFNKDGKVNVRDAAAIAKTLAKT